MRYNKMIPTLWFPGIQKNVCVRHPGFDSFFGEGQSDFETSLALFEFLERRIPHPLQS